MKETFCPKINEAVLFDAVNHCWCHFTAPQDIIVTSTLEDAVPCLEQVDKLVNSRNLHAAGFVSYEASPAFDSALKVHSLDDFPLLWFGLYKKCSRIDQLPSAQTLTAFSWDTSITPDAYRRGLTCEEDEALAKELFHSVKNRAENVMIVDMVRNDLGRIAQPGTVVSELFTIERYPTRYQMTTQVEARTEANMVDMFKAMFPPASITGAPKARTMEIIAELESSPPHVYTGTLGFILPGRRAQFNVAIRTVLVNNQRKTVEYGLGGGIVWDSNPNMELEECWTKARVCDPPPPPFSLLETLLWRPEEGFVLLEEHLMRISNSARFFSYPLAPEALKQTLSTTVAQLSRQPHRIRLLLDRDGSSHGQSFALQAPKFSPVRLPLDSEPVKRINPLLYHKTTDRRVYEAAMARFPDHEDVLLFNEEGQITESTIANFIVNMDGTLYTPPVQSGLLAGTYRNFLLESGTIQERVVTVETLACLSPLDIYLINSVRGMYPAILEGISAHISSL